MLRKQWEPISTLYLQPGASRPEGLEEYHSGCHPILTNTIMVCLWKASTSLVSSTLREKI